MMYTVTVQLHQCNVNLHQCNVNLPLLIILMLQHFSVYIYVFGIARMTLLDNTTLLYC